MRKRVEIDNHTLEKIANKNKLKLLKVLKKDGQLNQLKIQQKLGISYKETRRYINSLSRQGIIKKKTIKKEIGSPVMISLKRKK